MMTSDVHVFTSDVSMMTSDVHVFTSDVCGVTSDVRDKTSDVREDGGFAIVCGLVKQRTTA